MARIKGSPKTGGRKAGMPNKDKLSLREMIADKFPDYNPILALVAIALDNKNEEITYETRVTCHKEVAKYCYPMLRPVDAKGLSAEQTFADWAKTLKDGNKEESK